MPQNHAREVRETRPLSRRTKWTLGLSSAAVVIAAIVAILLTTGGKTELGCVNTYLPGVIGTQPYHECGRDARQTCATVRSQRKQFGTVGVIIVENACRAGHLAVG